ncbi:MAG: Holliday junction resolvase RuvX [Candidatus Cloacimonetes bacterium]|nr:Holliday junction resolvase RuvX [Candidatus Cloacimonadota bacterium]
MALDYGERRIGIALSDEDQLISFPFRTIDTRKTPDVVKEIVGIIKEQDVGAVIIGNPLTDEGCDSKKSKDIKAFTQMLSHHISVSITLWDESFTTKQALAVMNKASKKLKKNRDAVDQLAASLLLKDYLESQ